MLTPSTWRTLLPRGSTTSLGWSGRGSRGMSSSVGTTRTPDSTKSTVSPVTFSRCLGPTFWRHHAAAVPLIQRGLCFELCLVRRGVLPLSPSVGLQRSLVFSWLCSVVWPCTDPSSLMGAGEMQGGLTAGRLHLSALGAFARGRRTRTLSHPSLVKLRNHLELMRQGHVRISALPRNAFVWDLGQIWTLLTGSVSLCVSGGVEAGGALSVKLCHSSEYTCLLVDPTRKAHHWLV